MNDAGSLALARATLAEMVAPCPGHGPRQVSLVLSCVLCARNAGVTAVEGVLAATLAQLAHVTEARDDLADLLQLVNARAPHAVAAATEARDESARSTRSVHRPAP